MAYGVPPKSGSNRTGNRTGSGVPSPITGGGNRNGSGIPLGGSRSSGGSSKSSNGSRSSGGGGFGKSAEEIRRLAGRGTAGYSVDQRRQTTNDTRGTASDPFADFLSQYMDGSGGGGGGGRGGGGGGGSAGNGSMIAAQLQALAAQRKANDSRYAQNKSDYSNMYGQLTQKIRDATPTIQAAYDANAAAATQRSEGDAKATEITMADQQARRDASAAARGVSTQAAGSDAANGSDADLARDISNTRAAGADWTNLVKTNGQNAVQNNEGLAIASQGAGNDAIANLTQLYDQYVQQYDAQVNQINASYVPASGGGGGGGGRGGGGGGKSGGGKSAISSLPSWLQKEVFERTVGGGGGEQSKWDQSLSQLRSSGADVSGALRAAVAAGTNKGLTNYASGGSRSTNQLLGYLQASKALGLG